METTEATITRKGQIVIPAKLRHKYGIKAGTSIQLIDDGEQIILRPITPHRYASCAVFSKGKGGLQALSADRQAGRDANGQRPRAR
jgi:AbrB family looped-hinge helix DNA binding protein